MWKANRESPTSGVRAEISARAVLATFAIVTGIALTLGYIRSAIELYRGLGWNQVLPYLSLDQEQSLATWVSVALFGATGLFMFLGASGDRARGAGGRFGWGLLGGLFFFFALDEGMSLHETLNQLGTQLVPSGGIFAFGWVVFGLVVVAIAGLVFLPFLHRLPRATSLRLVLAGVIYVSGALGLEMIGGYAVETYGRGLASEMVADLEETLEMVGLWLALRAVLLHLSAFAPPFVFVRRRT
jgi:hypothetical protein